MDLDAIEAAEKAMTPGPWEKDRWATAHINAGERSVCSCSCYSNNQDLKVPEDNEANAEGIALLRNAAPDLIARIREQDAEIKRLRRFAADMSTTCYSCEVCGHARTTRECLRCEVKELRALCGEAASYVDFVNPTNAPSNPLYDRLRAASKGR